MKDLGALFQSGDWKGEKHVPVIKVPEKIKKDKLFELKVSIGDEIPHPNTLEHHISWIKVFFLPEKANLPIEIGDYNFTAHGEGEVFNEPHVVLKTKINKSGIIYALSYCNIHGLWENSIDITLED